MSDCFFKTSPNSMGAKNTLGAHRGYFIGGAWGRFLGAPPQKLRIFGGAPPKIEVFLGCPPNAPPHSENPIITPGGYPLISIRAAQNPKSNLEPTKAF